MEHSPPPIIQKTSTAVLQNFTPKDKVEDYEAQKWQTLSNKSGQQKAIFEGIKSNIKSSKLIQRLLSNCSQSVGRINNMLQNGDLSQAAMNNRDNVNALHLQQYNSMDLQTYQYAGGN